jgi:hypothetical protein
MLTAHTFNLILTPCAAALAVWLTVRFPNLRPRTIGVSCAHLAVAYLAIMTVAGSLIAFLYALPVPGSFELAAVAGALIPIVYLFLSLCWIVRGMQTPRLSRR